MFRLFFFFFLKNKKNLHRAVGPLLMANKVVSGEHHLADIAVETGFVPVLTMTKKAELFNAAFLKLAGLVIFKRGQHLINKIHFKEA